MKRHKPCFSGSCDHQGILGRKEKRVMLALVAEIVHLNGIPWRLVRLFRMAGRKWKAYLLFSFSPPLLYIFLSLSQYKINDGSWSCLWYVAQGMGTFTLFFSSLNWTWNSDATGQRRDQGLWRLHSLWILSRALQLLEAQLFLTSLLKVLR